MVIKRKRDSGARVSERAASYVSNFAHYKGGDDQGHDQDDQDGYDHDDHDDQDGDENDDHEVWYSSNGSLMSAILPDVKTMMIIINHDD